jgi:hypothetical protein
MSMTATMSSSMREGGATGRKLQNKVYYHHTGFIGGIKERTAKFILEGRFPERVVERLSSACCRVARWAG